MMEREQIRARYRFWIVINYSAVALLVITPMLAKLGSPLWIWISLLLLGLTGAVVSFYRVFRRTGLWKFTHEKTATLDERQRTVAYDALARAYSVIPAMMLVAMSFMLASTAPGWADRLVWTRPLGGMLAVGLVYLAHTLPGAIIAWRQLPPETMDGHNTPVVF